MAKKNQQVEALQGVQDLENAPDQAQVEAVKGEDYVSPPVAARTRRGQKAISPSKIPRRILAPKNENEALAEIEEARALLNKNGSEAELSDAEKDYAEEAQSLTNDELRNRLKNLGINVGPVVDSTRKIYEKKLVNLMSKAESGFSTDDNEEATPVGAEVEEPPKVVRRTRKKAPAEDLSKAEPVENFSDDDDIPIVQNTSSRRRSARVAKKESKKEVAQPETVPEEPAAEEKPSESGDAQPAAEEQSVEQVAEPAEAGNEPAAEAPAPSGEEAAEFAASSKFSFNCSCLENLPVHTIIVVVALALFMGLIWHQRDAHVKLVQNLTKMATYYYTQLYEAIMPGVDEEPVPAAEPVADN